MFHQEVVRDYFLRRYCSLFSFNGICFFQVNINGFQSIFLLTMILFNFRLCFRGDI